VASTDHSQPSYGVDYDDSYPLVRRLLHAPYVGLAVAGADGQDPDGNRIVDELRHGLLELGIEPPSIHTTSCTIGRSADAGELLAYVVGGALAIVAAIKNVDDAVTVVRKWWRALKRWRTELGSGHFTTEALKLACVDDLIERYGLKQLPRCDLMIATSAVGQFFDGTWRAIGPTYVVIPDPENERTHLYVAGADGEILHYALLPAFFGADDLRFLRGPATSAGASLEGSVVVPEEQHWDRDGGDGRRIRRT
jgi:hypothetical protein